MVSTAAGCSLRPTPNSPIPVTNSVPELMAANDFQKQENPAMIQPAYRVSTLYRRFGFVSAALHTIAVAARRRVISCVLCVQNVYKSHVRPQPVALTALATRLDDAMGSLLLVRALPVDHGWTNSRDERLVLGIGDESRVGWTRRWSVQMLPD
ncbi:hypothetical protein MMC07_005308 [Pseudocyphellaria aurata]|nr:hypothetical protein [Pseudocyphellaria aurata]